MLRINLPFCIADCVQYPSDRLLLRKGNCYVGRSGCIVGPSGIRRRDGLAPGRQRRGRVAGFSIAVDWNCRQERRAIVEGDHTVLGWPRTPRGDSRRERDAGPHRCVPSGWRERNLYRSRSHREVLCLWLRGGIVGLLRIANDDILIANGGR